jgi:hypothetical protein
MGCILTKKASVGGLVVRRAVSAKKNPAQYFYRAGLLF